MSRVRAVIPTEHDEQAALFAWAARCNLPGIELMYAVPNGGHRHKATAGRLKAEGVKPGCPDVCLPIPAGPYHGLYIEMKRRNASPSAVSGEQQWWIDSLTAYGYCAVVCRGWDEARAEIEQYLGRRHATGAPTFEASVEVLP